MPQLWQVAVNTPLRGLFTYHDETGETLKPGLPVKVPFGKSNRKVSGLLVDSVTEAPEGFELKSIAELHPDRPALNDKMLRWLNWLSDYYIHPLGLVQELVFPPLPKESKRGSRKAPVVPDVEKVEPHPLTPDQQAVLETIDLDKFGSYLLHGVTGSGKTEVYIRAIEDVLKAGKTAMVLLPEISLTPQLVRRFAERIPESISVIHSHLTPREKTDQWWLTVDGHKKLLIGARSALFCPMPDLGLIIVDEEHEASFKQDEKLKYNARDAAIMRAKIEDCPIILGSATPSLETWQNSIVGKHKLLTMAKRVSNRPLPSVEIIALNRKTETFLDLPYWLSLELYEKLKNNLESAMQSALFLNRRGMAPSVQCFDCGFTYMCPNCDISLTLHGKNHLVCHYCDYHETLSEDCPDCVEGEPKAYGLGTESVENDLQILFPEARILRADRDEINSRESLEDMVEKMERREVDILVGTQMIAKGFDFPNLTLVGLVLADIAFNIPDFRASERSFQLCTQVAGRAGRHQVPGEVIVQTFKNNHPSITFAQHHDFLGFAEQELEHRNQFGYPPFGKVAAIRLSGMRSGEVLQDGTRIVDFGNKLIEKYPELSTVQILGPAPAPLARIKNRYRFHILLKGTEYKHLNYVAKKLVDFMQDHCKRTKCQLDMDPYSLL